MGIVVPPAQCDITIYQGATFRHTYQWRIDGDQVDLSSAVVRAKIRHHYGKPQLATLTCTGDAEGHIAITLDADTTAQLVPVEAVWDLEVAWPDGEVCRLLMGKCLISPEVTR